MNSNSSPSDNTILSSDNVQGWIEMFTNMVDATPGGVLLFIGGERSLDSFVAGWHLVLASARNDAGNSAYTAIEHILPTSLGKRNVLDNIKLTLKTRTTDWDWPKKQIESLLITLKAHQLSTFEGTDVINTLKHTQNGAAVAISCVGMYRFSDIDASSMISIQTWPGIEYRWSTQEQKYLPHLLELTRQTLDLAKEKQLFVTLFCEEYMLDDNELPSDLQKHPDLAVVGTPAPSKYKNLGIFQNVLGKTSTEDSIAKLTDIAETMKNPIDCALLTSALLSANQQFNAAWTTVEPHLETLIDSYGTLLLGLSQTAIAAGKKPESEMLLRSAIERGIYWLEELNAAYLVAQNLNLDDLCVKLLAQMHSLYPSSKITQSLLYNQYCRDRNFSAALEIAENSKNVFQIELCRAFAKPQLDLTRFFASAKAMNKLENAYIAVAYEAEYRNEQMVARNWASKLGLDSKFSSNAIQIRTRIIGKTIRAKREITEEEIDELKQVMLFAAHHPSDLNVRLEIVDLLESGLEEPAAQIMLSHILLNAIDASFQVMASRNFSFDMPQMKDLLDDFIYDETEANLVSFCEGFFKHLSATPFMLGQGKVPNHLKPLVNQSLLRSLINMLHVLDWDFSDEEIQRFLLPLLHIIVLTSRDLDHPSSDLYAFRITLARLALAGRAQQARDLGETAIQILPGMQPSHIAWRTGQAWGCFADAFHRTGNTLAALRCLCLCFLSWDGPALDQHLLCSSYRLATRIFRDLRLIPYALQVVDWEREMRIMTDSSKQSLRELEQVKLSIQITSIGKDASPDLLLGFLAKIIELLNQVEDGEEITPLLACQANVIRLLKLADTEIPARIEDAFHKRLERVNESLRDQLLSALITTPTKSDLQSAIQRVASANSLEDLAYQVTSIHPLARNAVYFACQQKDSDLFILASTILSQPILSLKVRDTESKDVFVGSHRARSWLFQLLTGLSH
ncbi:MAG: hypothetical protein GY845_00305 [Planctomycetes bacterium]|nr:hypothetical protein [Planctomycetota bacterium]